MESPPSRLSQWSQFSSLSMPSSPSSYTGPRLSSSASSESSTLSDGPELQQYLHRLLPSVEDLLAGLSRVNQLTEDVLNIELQLQKVRSTMAEKRKKQDPRTSHNQSEDPQPGQSPKNAGLRPLPSRHQDAPEVVPRRRGTHSESSILGPVNHLPACPGKAWHRGQAAELEIRSCPRRRAWHSGSCHSAGPTQRFSRSQNPEDVPLRPRSEEGDRSEVSEGLPVKRRAWHPEDSEMEKDSAETKLGSIH